MEEILSVANIVIGRSFLPGDGGSSHDNPAS